MVKKDQISELVESVLDGTEFKLKVDAYRLEENLEIGRLSAECDVHDAKTGERQTIAGNGVGLVDAIFHAMRDKYSDQYASLKTIRFVDFSIRANHESGEGDQQSDMSAEVELHVANSEGRRVTFTHASQSITRSTVAVVMEAVEFFINSERAFIAVYRALQHARRENRPDSVDRYTGQLTVLVEATSYSEVIEQVKREEGETP
jgi:hypothetical protein